MTTPNCRFCGAPLHDVFVDLGLSPLANANIRPQDVDKEEQFFPLCAFVCANCFLVQLEQFSAPEEIFKPDYPYYSSVSGGWVDHSRKYVAQMVERLGLDADSHVVEVASNDGYLLQHFHERGIPVLGVEPAAEVAKVAEGKGIPTKVEFFGEEVGRRLAGEAPADLLIGNNVLAHVPDLNDFVAGLKALLKPGGVITMEFPHLMRLIEQNQWDTIYHEHFSYFSFLTVSAVFAAHGLRVFDVEELSTHGGSLRIVAAHADDAEKPESDAARELAQRERDAGYELLETYLDYGPRVEQDKHQILGFLAELKEQGLRIAAYGAPAKGNTLLNYCGIGSDLVAYTCDKSKSKQGQFLPGSRLPIYAPEKLREDKPDVVLILPWNIKDEIVEELDYVREWGGRFAARTPELKLLP